MDTLDSLSGSQRETLASFQAITATDDLDTALVLLNSTSWDLSVRSTLSLHHSILTCTRGNRPPSPRSMIENRDHQ
jgi:hypothetical protein